MQYKKWITHRIKELKAQGKIRTQAEIAQKLKIESSYLSRFLSQSQFQFSEDLLYRLLKILGADEFQIDRILMCYELERSASSERKAFLKLKLKGYEREKWLNELSRVRAELIKMVSLLEDSRVSLPNIEVSPYPENGNRLET